MKLEPNANSMSLYPKFRKPGDVVEGGFVSFTLQVPGNFGPEDVLMLSREDGAPLNVRCSAMLSACFRDNPPPPLGARVRIEFTHTTPNTKGKPTKHYTVEVAEEQSPTASAPRAQAQATQQRAASRPVAQPPRTYGQQQPHNPRQGPPPAQQAPAQGNFGDVPEDDLPF